MKTWTQHSESNRRLDEPLQRNRPSTLPLLIAIALVTTTEAGAGTGSKIELSWPAFSNAHEITIERGPTEDLVYPLARLPGSSVEFVDRSPPDRPSLCYRVAGVDSKGGVMDRLQMCFSRPSPIATVPAESEPSSDNPNRWRGPEGWFQVVPTTVHDVTPEGKTP